MMLFPSPFVARNSVFRGTIKHLLVGYSSVNTGSGFRYRTVMLVADGNIGRWHRYPLLGDVLDHDEYTTPGGGSVFQCRSTHIQGGYVWYAGNVGIPFSAPLPALFRAPLEEPTNLTRVATGGEGLTGKQFVEVRGFGTSLIVMCSDGSWFASVNEGATWARNTVALNKTGQTAGAGPGMFLTGLGSETSFPGLYTATTANGTYTSRTTGFNDASQNANSPRVLLAGTTNMVAAATGQVSSTTIAAPGSWAKRGIPAAAAGKLFNCGVVDTANRFMLFSAYSGGEPVHIMSDGGTTWAESAADKKPWGDTPGAPLEACYRDGRVYLLLSGRVAYTDDWGGTAWVEPESNLIAVVGAAGGLAVPQLVALDVN